MDATTQLDTLVPFYFQFYLPTTGLPYAPTPAPTVTVYVLNEATGLRTVLVAPGTALTAISGLTGAYVYLLAAASNTVLGQLVAEATTTDALFTPYPNYATRPYDVQVLPFQFTSDGSGGYLVDANAVTGGGGATAAQVWDYLTTAPNVPNSMKAYILTQLGYIVPGLVQVISPVEPASGNLTLYNQDYTVASGAVLPEWTSDTWAAYDLSNAVSITCTYQTQASAAETPLGTITAVSDTLIRFTDVLANIRNLPIGQACAGFKIVAVLDAAHGDDTVQLVNATLSHFNYRAVRT